MMKHIKNIQYKIKNVPHPYCRILKRILINTLYSTYIYLVDGDEGLRKSHPEYS